MKLFKILCISVCILFCVSQGYAQSKKSNVPDVLSGKEFILEQDPNVMIGFHKGGVYGYAFINTYIGRYELKSDKSIRLSYMLSTKVSGSKADEDKEYDYFDILEKSKNYKYDKNLGKLSIGKMVFIEKK